MDEDSTNLLQFYAEITNEHHSTGKNWGQLMGATHRLRFIIHLLQEILETENDAKIENFLNKLEYHSNSYYSRVYELRERAANLIASICKHVDLKNMLKSSKKRAAAFSKIENSAIHLLDSTRELFQLMDDDIHFRNFHVHDTFWRLGFCNGHDIYEPLDVLQIDLHNQPDKQDEFEAMLRAEARKMAEEYQRKAQRIIGCTMKLLDASGPDMRAEFVTEPARDM